MSSIHRFFKRHIYSNHIIIAILFLLFLYLLFLNRHIIALVFGSLIISLAVMPFNNFLVKYKLPRTIAVVIPYLILISLFIPLFTTFVPMIVNQSAELVNRLPAYIQKVSESVGIEYQYSDISNYFSSEFASITRSIFSFSSQVFSFTFSLFTVLIISIYISISYPQAKQYLIAQSKKSQEKRIQNMFNQLEKNLGAWVRGQIFLSVLIGLVTTLAYVVIGLPYAIPLGVLAGLLEVIPYLGPLIAAVPALILAFSISPYQAVITLLVFIAIQQLESSLLVPQVMKKVVGLPALVVIVALLVGNNLMGIIGAILSVPIVVLIKIIYCSFFTKNEVKSEN